MTLPITSLVILKNKVKTKNNDNMKQYYRIALIL